MPAGCGKAARRALSAAPSEAAKLPVRRAHYLGRAYWRGMVSRPLKVETASLFQVKPDFSLPRPFACFSLQPKLPAPMITLGLSVKESYEQQADTSNRSGFPTVISLLPSTAMLKGRARLSKQSGGDADIHIRRSSTWDKAKPLPTRFAFLI